MPRLAACSSLSIPFTLWASAGAQEPAQPSTYADYLARMTELRVFTGPTVQFSSYDRRSVAPGAPHWFANSDGFGGEPIPGFAATLRAPDQEGRGLWRVAAVRGPGAIVRTWSAGMGGTLAVHLDGNETPLYRGPADGFLREKTRAFLREAGVDLDVQGSFLQEDADYLPIPFARSLEITWEGKLRELHFYHVVVGKGSLRGSDAAPSFAVRDLATHRAQMARVHAALRGESEDDLLVSPQAADAGQDVEFSATLAPGASHSWTGAKGSIVRLAMRCTARDVATALRGVILRARFDEASVPQIESPLGDFFGSAPGVQPHRSLFFTVDANGWMTCRLPMPFEKACRIELENTTAQDVEIAARVHDRGRLAGTGYRGWLHAKWRAQHDLVATPAGIDIPYLTAVGDGVLVGVACLLMNPSGIPTAGGSWWGEGDEKIWVDGEEFPSTFGTGSEDFYNYAWSRPGLFAHAYCGQPTCTGPGTSGYVTNYRWLFADCVPFQRSLVFAMELLHHRRTPGFSYASIAYWYAGKAALDDHRALTARDLIVPALPKLGVVADGGAKGATIARVAELSPRSATPVVTWPEPLAPNHALTGFTARGGEEIALSLRIATAGRYALHVVALHRVDAAALTARIGATPLALDGARAPARVALVRASPSVQDVGFAAVDLEPGVHDLVLAAASPGVVGLDTVWWKRLGPIAFRAEGALEAEGLPIVAHSPGLAYEVQDLDPTRWSGGRHLWVRATRDLEFLELDVPVPEAGRWTIELQLTQSFDYGRVQVAIDGEAAGVPVDTWHGDVGLLPVLTLPPRELGKSARLRLQVVGADDRSRPPGRYFGIDWVRLRR